MSNANKAATNITPATANTTTLNQTTTNKAAANKAANTTTTNQTTTTTNQTTANKAANTTTINQTAANKAAANKAAANKAAANKAAANKAAANKAAANKAAANKAAANKNSVMRHRSNELLNYLYQLYPENKTAQLRKWIEGNSSVDINSLLADITKKDTDVLIDRPTKNAMDLSVNIRNTLNEFTNNLEALLIQTKNVALTLNQFVAFKDCINRCIEKSYLSIYNNDMSYIDLSNINKLFDCIRNITCAEDIQLKGGSSTLYNTDYLKNKLPKTSPNYSVNELTLKLYNNLLSQIEEMSKYIQTIIIKYNELMGYIGLISGLTPEMKGLVITLTKGITQPIQTKTITRTYQPYGASIINLVEIYKQYAMQEINKRMS